MFPRKTEHPSDVRVAILAKAPVAGLAKTRLIPHLGADGAAALQRWLLQRTVATAVGAGLGPVTLWCTPDVHHPEFAACKAFGAIELRCQPEGDLGERMHVAIAESPSCNGTLVIGTDCPALTSNLLRQAAETLQYHDAVVIPAEDGGYVLIGTRQAEGQLFQAVNWSTDQVIVQTRARLIAMNWRWREFPPLWDIDRQEDFERLTEIFPDALILAPQKVAGA